MLAKHDTAVSTYESSKLNVNTKDHRSGCPHQRRSPPLEAHMLERQHGKYPESHQVCCGDQHCVPSEFVLVPKVVPEKVVNDGVVAIKTLHNVIPVACTPTTSVEQTAQIN